MDNRLLKPIYRDIAIQDDGIISIRREDTWKILNGDNSVVTSYSADSVTSLMPNLFKITSGKRIMLVDKNQKQIGSQVFTSVGKFQNGKATIRDVNGKTGLIRRNGTVIVPTQYENLFSDGEFISATLKTRSGNRWILLDSM